MPFVVVTLYVLPFVFWFYSDGSAICRIRDLPWLQAARLHPRFAVASGGAPDGDGRAEGEAVDVCSVNTC